MAETIIHDKLPFPRNLGTPSTIFVQILVRDVKKLFTASYRVNSYDGGLYLTLQDVSRNAIVCAMKVVHNSNYFVRDANGRIMFILFIKDDDITNPDIAIFSQAQMEQFTT